MGTSGFALDGLKRVLQNRALTKDIYNHRKKIKEAYFSHPTLDGVEYKPDNPSPEELLEIEKIDIEAHRDKIKGNIFWTSVITGAVVFVVWFIWWMV